MPPPTRSAYWDGVFEQLSRARRSRAYAAAMGALYAGLATEWLPPPGRALKTDLFEEALGERSPLAALGAGSLGVDVSPAVARQARARSGRPVLAADVRALPLRDACLERVLSGSSLDHFETRDDLERALAELARVLSPGGVLLLTLDNPENPAVRVRNALPFAWLRRLGLVPYYVGVTLDRRTATAALERAGLEVLESRPIAHAPRLPALVLMRFLERTGADPDRLGRFVLRFEALASWPTRWLTAYYVALRARRPGGAA